MLIYCIFTTFVLGLLIGSIVTVKASLYIENHQKETERRKSIHPSTRELGDDTPVTILDYSNVE